MHLHHLVVTRIFRYILKHLNSIVNTRWDDVLALLRKYFLTSEINVKDMMQRCEIIIGAINVFGENKVLKRKNDDDDGDDDDDQDKNVNGKKIKI